MEPKENNPDQMTEVVLQSQQPKVVSFRVQMNLKKKLQFLQKFKLQDNGAGDGGCSC